MHKSNSSDAESIQAELRGTRAFFNLIAIPTAGILMAAGVYIALLIASRPMLDFQLVQFLVIWTVYSFVGFLTEGIVLYHFNLRSSNRLDRRFFLQALILTFVFSCAYYFEYTLHQSNNSPSGSFILLPVYGFWLIYQRQILGKFLAVHKNLWIAASILIDGTSKIIMLSTLNDFRHLPVIFVVSTIMSTFFLAGAFYMDPKLRRLERAPRRPSKAFVALASQSLIALSTIGAPSVMVFVSAVSKTELNAQIFSTVVIDRAAVLFVAFAAGATFIQLISLGKLLPRIRFFILIFTLSSLTGFAISIGKSLFAPSHSENQLSTEVIAILVSSSLVTVSLFVGYFVFLQSERRFFLFWVIYASTWFFTYIISSIALKPGWALSLSQVLAFTLAILICTVETNKTKFHI